MEARATVKFARYTPRKVNQVLSLIRGKNLSDSVGVLAFLPKSASELVHKTLISAAANAGALKKMSSFKVLQAWVCNGSMLKRMRPADHGRARPIKKRMVHLTIVITDENVEKTRNKKNKSLKAIQ